MRADAEVFKPQAFALRPVTEHLARQMCVMTYGAAVGMEDISRVCDEMLKYPGSAEMWNFGVSMRLQIEDIKQRLELLRRDAHYAVDISAQMPSLIVAAPTEEEATSTSTVAI